MSSYDAVMKIEMTPAMLAEAFWRMGSDEQADFFAALGEIAGPTKLCFQMAGVVMEMHKRRDLAGDFRPWLAFETMLGHANDMAQSHIEAMHWDARREIARAVEAAKYQGVE